MQLFRTASKFRIRVELISSESVLLLEGNHQILFLLASHQSYPYESSNCSKTRSLTDIETVEAGESGPEEPASGVDGSASCDDARPKIGTEMEPPVFVKRMERRLEAGVPRGRSTTTMPPTKWRAPVRSTKSAPQRYTTLILYGFLADCGGDPDPCATTG